MTSKGQHSGESISSLFRWDHFFDCDAFTNGSPFLHRAVLNREKVPAFSIGWVDCRGLSSGSFNSVAAKRLPGVHALEKICASSVGIIHDIIGVRKPGVRQQFRFWLTHPSVQVVSLNIPLKHCTTG